MCSAYGQKKTHSERLDPYPPAVQQKMFELQPGFVIELVASEADGIVNPIDLTFDDAGRLWTQTARMYPLDPVNDLSWGALQELLEDQAKQDSYPGFKRVKDLYEGKVKGDDEILILDHLYDDEVVTVNSWARGLAIPMSILPYKDGVVVAQGSEMIYLKDGDGDGMVDQRKAVLKGFGFTDTHTMAHTLIKGPGGWLYFSQGALNKGEVYATESDAKLRIDYSKIVRFKPDGQAIELVNAGLNNIWGVQLRSNGQWYGIEANDLGYSVVPMEGGTAYPGIGNDKLRSYQPFMPRLHEFRVGGTGLSGLAFADDESGSFPSTFENVALLANPITNAINAVRIIRKPDGRVEAEVLPDLLKSTDDWFRPVNLEFGPDGCLYIADWYNKIVSHNEVTTSHPDRDKSHGRIWRIRHVDQKPRRIPNFYTLSPDDLIDYLTAPSLWMKRAAWNQIDERSIGETKHLTSALLALLEDDDQTEVTRIHALWSLESIGQIDVELWRDILQSAPDNLKREAIRSLSQLVVEPVEYYDLLKILAEDDNPQIRAQVLRTLGEFSDLDFEGIGILVQACKVALSGNDMGGSYERRFERYLARKALESYPVKLTQFLDREFYFDHPKENVLWAIAALPDRFRSLYFIHLWQNLSLDRFSPEMFIEISNMLDENRVYRLVDTVFQNPKYSREYLNYMVEYKSNIRDTSLARMMEPVVLASLESEDDVELALKVISLWKMEKANEGVLTLFNSGQTSERHLDLIIQAMKNNAKSNIDIFASISSDPSIHRQYRLKALQVVSNADIDRGGKLALSYLEKAGKRDRASFVKEMATSVNGCGILLNLLDEKVLVEGDIPIEVAERMKSSRPDDARSVELYGKLLQANQKKNPVKEEIDIAIEKVNSHSANLENGKILFKTCLMCHSVGGKGVNFGPALDGSAYRSVEAIVTALIDPDAAVESGYAVYRVEKGDGSNLQGYLISQNDNGVTLGFMGGGETFIPQSEIVQQGFLQGRSFMLRNLIAGYSDQELADLVGYIQSLK